MARTTIEWIFTSLMWALWIYLFLPMATLILWSAGIHYIYHSVIEPAALMYLIAMLTRLGWAVVIIFVALRGWGYYNYYVFGRLDRRKSYPEPSTFELAEYFGLTEDRLLALQEEKEILWEVPYDALKQGQTLHWIPYPELQQEADPVLNDEASSACRIKQAAL